MDDLTFTGAEKTSTYRDRHGVMVLTILMVVYRT